MAEPLVIVLDGVRPPSWNALKRMSPHAWHDEVQKAKLLMRAAIGPLPAYFTGRVDIDVVAYFTGRPLDSSNIPVKLYEDGLKGMVVCDDSPHYVRRVSAMSAVDRRRPRVEVTVTPVEE